MSTNPPEPGPDGWHRLSRRMLLVHPVQELTKALPLLLSVLVFGHAVGHHSNWAYLITALAVAAGLLRWYTTRYRIAPDPGPALIELRHGLLLRKHIALPIDRVRTVELTAGASHRLLGLATVTIGTGRGGDPRREGLRLDALRRPQALALREALLGQALGAAVTGDRAADGGAELLRFRPGWFRFALLAPAGLGPVLAIALAGTGPLGGPVSQTPPGAALHWLLTVHAPGPAAVRIPLALLLGATAINLLTFVQRAVGFSLSRLPGGALEIRHGLLNRRSVTLERRRVYGVELSQSLPLRLVGGAHCTAVAMASARERSGPALAPGVPLRDALAVAAEVLGGDGPLRAPLTGHGPRARTRRLTRALSGWALGLALAAAAAAAGLLPPWVAIAWVALLPLTVPLALDRHRALGHAVADGRLVVASGSLVRRRAVIAGEGVIGWNLRRSWGQRRAGLVTLTATTAAGRRKYAVADLPVEQLPELADQVLPGLLTPFLVPATD